MTSDSPQVPPLLPGRFVALDFESTGLSSARDRIIDIGAVECIDGVLGRRFQTLVNPGMPIPAAITRLTGIDDAAVAGAPTFAKAAPELLAFLGDSPILAHNARFEHEFLTTALGREVPNRFLDTLELAGLVRAHDPRRSLGHLAQIYGIREHEVHRGLEDALDCLAVAQRVLEGLVVEGRRGLVDRVLQFLDGTGWTWLPVFRLLRTIISAPEPRPTPASRDRSPDTRVEPEDYERVSADEVRAAFASGGPLSRGFQAWEPRAQQLEMAEAVASALSEGRSLMVEAPTGVGKSLAYLVPAGLFARKNGVRVLVATQTKNLQDQLGSQDLPRAAQALGEGFAWRVLKGQENYLCTVRTSRWLDAPTELAETENERLLRAYVASFLELTTDGDLERFMPWHAIQGPHVARALEHIRSTSPACSNPVCLHGRGCFYQRAVYAAREADVVVTNHALALVWPERYPASRHLIVDEAHALEDAATSRFASVFDPARLARLFDDLLGRSRAGGLLESAAKLAKRGSAADPSDARGFDEWLARATAQARAAAAAVGPIRTACERLISEAGVKGGDEGRRTQRLVAALHGHAAYVELAKRAADWAAAASALLRDLSSMVDTLGYGGPGETVARELAGSAEPLESARDLLEEAFGGKPQQGYVYWIEVEDMRGSRNQRIRGAPVSVAALVVENLFARFRSVLLTSATLTLGAQGDGGSAFVARRIGFDRLPSPQRAPFLKLASPFDLEHQLVLGIPNDLADVNTGEAFVKDVTRVLADVARALGGRTLALFAANRRRDLVGERLERELRGEGIEVLVQGTGGGRDRLVQALREGGRKVVLGSRSLWEGVDVPGAALSCVVIEKLPFDFPGEPLHQAREEAVREGGGDAFDDFTLPRALLRFQQGVGRLVRSRGDRGVVLLLQSNLYRRAYAKRVIDALPGIRVLTTPWSEIHPQLAHLTDPAP